MIFNNLLRQLKINSSKSRNATFKFNYVQAHKNPAKNQITSLWVNMYLFFTQLCARHKTDKNRDVIAINLAVDRVLKSMFLPSHIEERGAFIWDPLKLIRRSFNFTRKN